MPAHDPAVLFTHRACVFFANGRCTHAARARPPLLSLFLRNHRPPCVEVPTVRFFSAGARACSLKWIKIDDLVRTMFSQ